MSFNDEKADSGQLMRLIAEAKCGRQESLNALTELVQPQLCAYLLRSTLDKTLTDDLVQETLMQMVKSITTLQKPESFWPWLFRIAGNKFNEHLRAKKIGHTESIQSLIDSAPDHGHSQAIHALSYKEMTQAVFESMAELKHIQRQIVSMRCFDNLSFAQIGETLDCSENQARVMFHRTRKTLQSHLQRRGFGTAMTAVALVLFGQATSPAGASTAYAAAVPVILEETAAFSVKSFLGIKAAKLIATIAACLVTIGGIWGYHSFTAASALVQLPQRSAVKSFHFVAQSWDGTSNMPNTNLARGRSLSKGAYEQWFFFPEGVDGPMFMMMQRWNPQQTVKLCGWLQNAGGNYYYHSGQKTIYLYNAPLPLGNLQTRRLPTDTAELTEFLDQVEGKNVGINYERDSKTGLLTGALDNRFYNAQDFRAAITYNNLNEVSFGAFRHQWPDDTLTVDERDQMHKRGWTCFEISGTVNGQQVHGIGRVPFIYDKLADYPPALSLTIGNMLHKVSITDVPSGAKLIANEEPVGLYPGGSFFKGLARPWMGMHTLDLLRRDAAEKRIWFKMKNLGTRGGTDEKVELSLLGADGGSQTKLTYRINMERDIIEKMEFWSGDSLCGSLSFEFPENFNELEAALVKQFENTESKSAKPRQADGIWWLFDLAKGTLVK